MTRATNPDILWIEDDAAVSSLYTEALQKLGYRVRVESDGLRGLELARSDDYDFILVDLMLPSMSGSKLLHALRGNAAVPPLHSKIIIMTNLEQRPEIRSSIERLADAYLIKAEVTPKQLASLLARMTTPETT